MPSFLRNRWIIAAAALLAIVLVGWWSLRPPGRVWDTGHEVGLVTFSPDGQLLASVETTSDDERHPEIVLRHVPNGQVVATLRGEQFRIRTLAFSPDGSRIAAAGLDWKVRIWTVTDGRLITVMTDSTNDSDVYALAWRPDGTEIITVSRDGSARWWLLRDGTLLRTAQVVADFKGEVAFNPRRELVAYFAVGGPAGIWRAADAQLMTPIAGVFGSPVFSGNGHLVAATGCQDGYVLCIWNVDTGRIIAVFKGHTDSIQSIAFSPDGTLVASASGLNPIWGNGNVGDRTIRLWRIADGKALATLTVHSSYIYGLAFSPDGKYLASGSFDRRIGLWNVADMARK